MEGSQNKTKRASGNHRFFDVNKRAKRCLTFRVLWGVIFGSLKAQEMNIVCNLFSGTVAGTPGPFLEHFWLHVGVCSHFKISWVFVWRRFEIGMPTAMCICRGFWFEMQPWSSDTRDVVKKIGIVRPFCQSRPVELLPGVFQP